MKGKLFSGSVARCKLQSHQCQAWYQQHWVSLSCDTWLRSAQVHQVLSSECHSNSNSSGQRDFYGQSKTFHHQAIFQVIDHCDGNFLSLCCCIKNQKRINTEFQANKYVIRTLPYLIMWQTPRNRLQDAEMESKSEAFSSFTIWRSNSFDNSKIGKPVDSWDWKGSIFPKIIIPMTNKF